MTAKYALVTGAGSGVGRAAAPAAANALERSAPCPPAAEAGAAAAGELPPASAMRRSITLRRGSARTGAGPVPVASTGGSGGGMSATGASSTTGIGGASGGGRSVTARGNCGTAIVCSGSGARAEGPSPPERSTSIAINSTMTSVLPRKNSALRLRRWVSSSFSTGVAASRSGPAACW